MTPYVPETLRRAANTRTTVLIYDGSMTDMLTLSAHLPVVE